MQNYKSISIHSLECHNKHSILLCKRGQETRSSVVGSEIQLLFSVLFYNCAHPWPSGLAAMSQPDFFFSLSLCVNANAFMTGILWILAGIGHIIPPYTHGGNLPTEWSILIKTFESRFKGWKFHINAYSMHEKKVGRNDNYRFTNCKNLQNNIDDVWSINKGIFYKTVDCSFNRPFY